MIAFLVVILSLVAVKETIGYRNSFARNHHRAQRKQNNDHLLSHGAAPQSQRKERSTALFSLGDPDTKGESNFYRW
jgi:hypothetical protein